MFKIIQESTLPKLSETGLYKITDQTSKITECVKTELQNLKENEIKPDDIKDILSLIRLNGDNIARKAVDAYQNGKIVISYNNTTSKIPELLPYLVIIDKNTNKPKKVVIFANTFMDNINSSNQYTRLMSAIEAAYLAYKLCENQDEFTMNAVLMMNLCSIYAKMVVTPLRSMGFIGDNMTKATLYTIAYFYQMFKGADISVSNIPFKRLVADNVEPSVITQIVQDVKDCNDKSFMGFIELLKKINPVSYKNINNQYIVNFVEKCGHRISFALENIAYLFFAMTSSLYGAPMVSLSFGKLIKPDVRKILQNMSPIIS